MKFIKTEVERKKCYPWNFSDKNYKCNNKRKSITIEISVLDYLLTFIFSGLIANVAPDEKL